MGTRQSGTNSSPPRNNTVVKMNLTFEILRFGKYSQYNFHPSHMTLYDFPLKL